MSDQGTTTTAPLRGPTSFCIPRAAFEALLDAKATVYEIAAYLVLANHTDATGKYSTASVSAINRRTGSNKTRNGPVHRAIDRLKSIHATMKREVQEPQYTYAGKSKGTKTKIETVDLGPILVDRETWHTSTGEVLPDGPMERAKVLFVLPDFGEPLESRIWFGGNLVTGVGQFDMPLRSLIHTGDAAARLLLTMYAANDMETWGGVRPVGADQGPYHCYEPVDEGGSISLRGNARLLRSQESARVATIDARIGSSNEAYWEALEALQSGGFIYEMVMVLNRHPTKATFSNGQAYSAIPNDAEPYYELDARSRHGYKPTGEEGIGGATAKTAGDLGRPVTERNDLDEPIWDTDGSRLPTTASRHFNGTYAAIVPSGYQAMIAGIFRIRFRVANTLNAGVKGSWARIYQNNREAFAFLQAVRASHGMQPLVPPWDRGKTPETTVPPLAAPPVVSKADS